MRALLADDAETKESEGERRGPTPGGTRLSFPRGPTPADSNRTNRKRWRRRVEKAKRATRNCAERNKPRIRNPRIRNQMISTTRSAPRRRRRTPGYSSARWTRYARASRPTAKKENSPDAAYAAGESAIWRRAVAAAVARRRLERARRRLARELVLGEAREEDARRAERRAAAAESSARDAEDELARERATAGVRAALAEESERLARAEAEDARADAEEARAAAKAAAGVGAGALRDARDEAAKLRLRETHWVGLIGCHREAAKLSRELAELAAARGGARARKFWTRRRARSSPRDARRWNRTRRRTSPPFAPSRRCSTAKPRKNSTRERDGRRRTRRTRTSGPPRRSLRFANARRRRRRTRRRFARA